MDQLMETFLEDMGQPSPSISVLVIENGQAVYMKSFGYSNVDTLEKATPKTNYRLASMSKMFTAMGILVLMDQDKLEESTKVNTLLKDFPAYGKDITVGHLLRHQQASLIFTTTQTF